MENFNKMQRLFGKYYFGLPLAIMIIYFLIKLF